MYDWVEGDMKWELEHASSLGEVIEIVHSDWSSQQKADLRNFLTASQIGATGYRDNWMDYDDQYSSYAQQRDQAAAEDAANTSKYTSAGWTQDPNGNWYPPQSSNANENPSVVTDASGNSYYKIPNGDGTYSYSLVEDKTTSNAMTPYQSAQIAADNAALEWQKLQDALDQQRWQQENSWTKFTDASGVWQKNQLGQVQFLGDVPQGVVQNLPETWAGWGKQWEKSPQYNPTTQRMDTIYGATPLTPEATLAQSQWANQPGSWYDVALLNRQLNPTEQKYQTQVGNTVGALVSNRQGYDPRYDLQSGQAATGVTPGGWFDTSQNSNAWQQGYPASVGGTGNGEVGGYQTQIMNYGDYMNNADARDELSGWLNSGFADYTPQQYADKQQRLRPPKYYQGVSYR